MKWVFRLNLPLNLLLSKNLLKLNRNWWAALRGLVTEKDIQGVSRGLVDNQNFMTMSGRE